MHYELVFDTCASGYRNWWFPALGIAFAGLNLGYDRFVEPRLPRFLRPRWRFPPIVIYGFISLWIAVALCFTTYDFLRVCGALRAGDSIVVEGEVRDFLPASEKRRMEAFTVAGRRYEYSEREVRAGFNTTASHGGPVHEGLRVRIHEVDGQIGRLEVSR